jgi:hypothetical protein
MRPAPALALLLLGCAEPVPYTCQWWCYTDATDNGVIDDAATVAVEETESQSADEACFAVASCPAGEADERCSCEPTASQ